MKNLRKWTALAAVMAMTAQTVDKAPSCEGAFLVS